MIPPMSHFSHVNPLQGSESSGSFSSGNCWPLLGTPRGLTYWTPQTDQDRFTYDLHAVKLQGFRATHAPSPWMGDYGHFDILPVVGKIYPTPGARASSYQRHLQKSEPSRYQVHLQRYGIDLTVAATRACAVFDITFPPDCGDTASIVLQTGLGEHLTLGEVTIAHNTIHGTAYSHHSGCHEKYACHFIAELSGAEVASFGTMTDSELKANHNHIKCPRAGAYLTLKKPLGKVTLRVATSFIDIEQARLNLRTEVGTKDATATAAASHATWDKWLSKIDAGTCSENDRTVLYSALYRAGLFPTAGHEFNANGEPHHRSPHDGELRGGVFYTNNGFWDTSRTVYPLLTLIDPVGYGEIVEGFLAHFRQTGWLPKWCSPGHRDCMIGSHSDIVISEAIAAGITGFDPMEAYEAVRKNAFEPVHGHGKYGRAALEDYIRLGYVPSEAAQYSVSWTLDNAHCDWALAQTATKLGRHEDSKTLAPRAQNYRNLWHPESRLMRPKDAQGNWLPADKGDGKGGWSETRWGHDYVEGSAWQHSFHVPHDPQGLASLLGGTKGLLTRLEDMFNTPPRFHVGHYHFEIHEMTEMAYAYDKDGRSFGQYAHSNQPVHGFLWLAAALGETSWASHHIQRVMSSLYTPTHLPGDEDNGEMSSWYLLGALGKIPRCPGSAKFIDLPSPMFKGIRIKQ